LVDEEDVEVGAEIRRIARDTRAADGDGNPALAENPRDLPAAPHVADITGHSHEIDGPEIGLPPDAALHVLVPDLHLELAVVRRAEGAQSKRRNVVRDLRGLLASAPQRLGLPVWANEQDPLPHGGPSSTQATVARSRSTRECDPWSPWLAARPQPSLRRRSW